MQVISLFLTRQIPLYLKSYFNVTSVVIIRCLSHHMMSIYPMVRIELLLVQFSLLCYEFCILSKTECKSIYYHFRRDHESRSFQKRARNKWICQETGDFYLNTDLFECIFYVDHIKRNGVFS